MKVLFIAPLPPPVTGHSLASQVLWEDLRRAHDVDIVDLSAASEHDGRVTARRILRVARALSQVRPKSVNADAVYLTVAESVAGNLKDLCIYLLCRPRLPHMFVHLHGGTLRAGLFDRHPILKRLNALFIRRLGGVIVTGQTHLSIFEGMIAPEKVHVVPNFAQDHLFIEPELLTAKFRATRPLRILYLSAMTRMKGYGYLVAAIRGLAPEHRRAVHVDFAGEFPNEGEKQEFLDSIADTEQIRYHGEVRGRDKQALLERAHLFCLPTGHLEGQPVSILEAYAAGCVVLTTGRGGIPDVFTHRVNGFQIPPRTPDSIRGVIEDAIADPSRLLPIALANNRTARQLYRAPAFNARVRAVLETNPASLPA